MTDIDSTATGDEQLRARRAFLKVAPLGALALVAGPAPAAAAAAPVAAAAQPAQRGYHETEHIRRYYQTAAYW
ncbi:formate dehydrogenase [[Empedobacter] haloabium]|uniref:Formate dehydrogenase n=1 Tax=[Empedobacter] haloabium TaxID=592317 RepID=A0ABZ1URK5_9BURK